MHNECEVVDLAAPKLTCPSGYAKFMVIFINFNAPLGG